MLRGLHIGSLEVEAVFASWKNLLLGAFSENFTSQLLHC
jgi:hypothetical protein